MKDPKTEPRPVHSCDELFEILRVMEHEAAARYEALAIRMTERGAGEVAAVFRRLAEEEREHGNMAARWLEESTGQARASVVDRRDSPNPVEADETVALMGVDRHVTPYAAFSLAVRGEERAFAYWSYVSAQAKDPRVKAAAESIAHEELEHAALLRRERRRAYHGERGRAHQPTGGPKSALALLRAAEAIELRLGKGLERLASHPKQVDRAGARDLSDQSYQIVGELRRLAGDTRSGTQAPVTEDADVPLAIHADDLVERYLAIAERADDEALVKAAQSLAQKAIARLALLREFVLTPNNC